MSLIQENPILCALECPVCNEHMAPPIRQCIRGHSFCNRCFERVEFCPVCRSHKDPDARCWALEKIYEIIEIPCKNAYVGCLVRCKGEDIQHHVNECSYKIRSCPFKHYDECTWSSFSSNLEEHLNLNHSRNFYKNSWQVFVARNFKGMNTYQYIYIVIHAYDEFFRITWDLDELTGEILFRNSCNICD